MRAYKGLPHNPSQSEALTDTACTWTRTWLSLGTGVGTSVSRSSSGGPYRVYTTAFTPGIVFGERIVHLRRGETEVFQRIAVRRLGRAGGGLSVQGRHGRAGLAGK